jgi:plasmid stabilization system protein ParE
MTRIEWSPRALSDLDAIHSYIALVSIVYADHVVRRLIAAAERLADFPEIGRVVPELREPQLRERIVRSANDETRQGELSAALAGVCGATSLRALAKPPPSAMFRSCAQEGGSMKRRLVLRFVLVATTVALLGGPSLAAEEAPPAPAPPTAEQREKLAVAHEQMAACLRSEKPFTECHAEMHASCQQTMGAQGCPMMAGGMGMGMRRGMMGHGMQGQAPAPDSN